MMRQPFADTQPYIWCLLHGLLAVITTKGAPSTNYAFLETPCSD
jgi:hypothetical protein